MLKQGIFYFTFLQLQTHNLYYLLDSIIPTFFPTTSLLAKVLAYEHEDLIKRLQEKEAFTEKVARDLFLDMKRFLLLCGTSKQRLAPSELIDTAWHHFILYTRDYDEFCKTYFGSFIVLYYRNYMKPLPQLFIQHLPSGGRILDLGAGAAVHARQFAERGFIVDAVDRAEAPTNLPAQVTWHQQDVMEFMESFSSRGSYDGIFLRNIIQFLDKNWVMETLLPMLFQALSPGGVLLIETFWKAPEPPFAISHPSFYEASEFSKIFADATLLHSVSTTESGTDLKGLPRIFHMTRVLVRKT